MGDSYNALGVLHKERDDTDKAERMFTKALKIAEALHNREGISDASANLAIVYFLRDEISKAEGLVRRALSITNELGNVAKSGVLFRTLGLIHSARNESKEAVTMINRALDVHKNAMLPEEVAADCGCLALVCRQCGELVEARKYEIIARDLYTHIGMPHRVDMVNKFLAELPDDKPDS